MNYCLYEFHQVFLEPQAWALESTEFLAIGNSFMVFFPLTIHTVLQTALVAPLIVAFMFQNL